MPYIPAQGICDYCGKDTGEKTNNISITIRDSEDVIFEYWNKGYYCPECAEKLIDGILSSMPVPERYDDDFSDSDKCIELEKEIIKEQTDSWK